MTLRSRVLDWRYRLLLRQAASLGLVVRSDHRVDGQPLALMVATTTGAAVGLSHDVIAEHVHQLLRTTETPVATAADTLAAWPMAVPVVMGRMPKGAE